jgi:hypothetical protein
MNAETIGLLIAGLGALTGIIALAINLFADRSRLKLNAVMTIESNEKMSEPHLVFTLEVVNHGRRVSRIKHAGIQIEPREMNVGEIKLKPFESEITLFDSGKTGRSIELTEDKPHIFVLEPFREILRDTEIAFVIDTRGRKFTTKFNTMSLKDVPKKVN